MEKKPLESFMSPLQMKGGDLWQLLKGEKGDKGEKGIDGKDGADGRDGIDGIDGIGLPGKDGKDAEVNIFEVLEAITPLLPDTDDIIKKVKKSFPKQKELKLEELEGKFIRQGTKFTSKDIDDLEEVLKKLRDEIREDGNELIRRNMQRNIQQYGGPSLLGVKANGGGAARVQSINFSTGFTVTPTGDGTNVDITATSAGAEILTTASTIDDSNVSFVFVSKPTLININGTFYRETKGWSWNAGTLTATLDSAVGVNGDIYGLS